MSIPDSSAAGSDRDFERDYWLTAGQSTTVAGALQRHELYLGEINSSQGLARRSIGIAAHKPPANFSGGRKPA